MLGGRNGTFFVPDALTAKDARAVGIAAHDFAEEHAIRTVFGMGGAYVDGTPGGGDHLLIGAADRIIVDRFSTSSAPSRWPPPILQRAASLGRASAPFRLGQQGQRYASQHGGTGR